MRSPRSSFILGSVTAVLFVAACGGRSGVGEVGSALPDLRVDSPRRPDWEATASGTKRNLLAIAGGADGLVAGGEGTILQWDGSRWAPAPKLVASDLLSVWVDRLRAEAYAVGLGGAVLRRSAGAWAKVVPLGSPLAQGLQGVWGDGDSVWVVGQAGTILRAVAGKWSTVASGTTSDLRGVWGSDAKDVWAVGYDGVILRWDGVAWARVESNTSQHLLAVWGSGPGAVWAVGVGGVMLRWDGVRWSAAASGTTTILRSVWGTGPQNAWVVGDGGMVLRWRGGQWTPELSGVTADLYAVGGDELATWVGGGGGLLLRHR